MRQVVCLLAISLSTFSLAAQPPRLVTTERWITNSQGNDIGLVVHVGPVAMSVTAPHLGPISAPGLPTVELSQDERQRDEVIRTTSGTTLAELRYSRKDYLQRVTLADGYRLELSDPDKGRVTETLKTPHEKTLHTGIVAGMADRAGQIMPLCLDAVASDIGMDFEWREHVRFSLSDSGRLTTVSDASGKTLLYVLNYGTVRVGYLPSGKALFYDLPVSTSSGMSVLSGGDLGDSPMGEMNGVAIDRLLVTGDGRVCAYTRSASLGAIHSFWTTRDTAGNPVYAFRRTGRGSQSRVSTTTTPDASAPAATPAPPTGTQEPAARRRLLIPQCMYIDRSYSESYTSDYGTDWYWHNDGYWDCSDTGGYDPATPDLAGGGVGPGGSASGGNQVTGDATLYGHVGQALSKAQTKLQNLSSNCVQQILSLHDANGNTLAANLQNINGGPWSPGAYMSQELSYVNGYMSGKCAENAVAWMANLFSTQVNVCTTFSNLTVSMGGNRLIHEFLHSIGLPESPPYSGAMTSAQINAFVDNACGTN